MRTPKRALFVLAAVLLMVGAIAALAQEPSSAQGQLLRVDANAKTLMIRTADGTQMRFIYTDDTRVTGADDSIAGLATITGADVTVSYTVKQQDNIATQIEVKKTTTVSAPLHVDDTSSEQPGARLHWPASVRNRTVPRLS